MEQKVKAGDYVILTDPLNYGKRVKVKEANDDGTTIVRRLRSVSIGESCVGTSYWLCWIKARR